MQFYAVGDTWTDTLPAGDSWGVYWQEEGGMWLLAALENLRAEELEGFRSGHCEVAAGMSCGVLVVATKWAGSGWCESAIGNVELEGFNPVTAATAADSWKTSGVHGTLTSFLVEKLPTGSNVISALRYFTLSPHTTAYVGRVLADMYRRPAISQFDYVHAVMLHQTKHPTTAGWVRDGSAVRCRAGD